MTLMRAALHLVSAGDGTRDASVSKVPIERAPSPRAPFAAQLSGLELGPVISRGVELVEHEPLSISQLGAALSEHWPNHDANSARLRASLPRPPGAGDAARHLGQDPPAEDHDARELARPPASVHAERRRAGHPLPPRIRPCFRCGHSRLVVARRCSRDRRPAQVTTSASTVTSTVGSSTTFATGCSAIAPHRPGSLLAAVRQSLPRTPRPGTHHRQVKWDSSFLHHGTVFVDGFLSGAWKLSERKREATLVVELRTRVQPHGARRHVRREAEAAALPDARCLRAANGAALGLAEPSDRDVKGGSDGTRTRDLRRDRPRRP